MAILFDYHINYLSDSGNETELPFNVFGLTQQGVSHFAGSIGNQDAGSVFVGKRIIIGVVADGCTSGTNVDGKSSNQVGANITSYLVCRIIRKLLIKKGCGLDNLSDNIESELHNHYRRILNAINPWQFERNKLINNLFTSTFIAFVVYKDKYAVYNCGDGNLFINGNEISLKYESGRYFSNNLINFPKLIDETDDISKNAYVKVNCIASNGTNQLNTLLICTDGFVDIDVLRNKSFSDFFFTDENKTINKKGFIDNKTKFRHVASSILEEKDGRNWPFDDATFISLKRKII